MPPDAPDAPKFRTSPVSFTRRGGRLSDRQQRVWDQLADEVVIEVPSGGPSTSVAQDYRFDPTDAFGRDAELTVEIGSGYGEALTHAAAENPNRNFLGLEVYVPAIAQTLLHIRRLELTNIRLAIVNAPEMLETAIAAGSVGELRIWFPDPWHKKRHNKRRLITDEFATIAARAVSPGGLWRVPTAWADYGDQIARVLANSPDFDSGRTERFSGRPMTRFEAKGTSVDREIYDFCARRLTT